MTEHTLQRMMEAIYSRCRRLLGDPEQAWDALQEVFTRYYEATQHQTVRQPLHFLYRTSTNYCIDQLRVRGRYFPLEETGAESLASAANSLSTAATEGHILVQKLIDRFGQEVVEMLTYRHVDQMTYKEIAALYGLSDRGVQKKLERIEEMMRKYLNR